MKNPIPSSTILIAAMFICSCRYERRQYNLSDIIEQQRKDLIREIKGRHTIYFCDKNKFTSYGKVKIRLKKNSIFLMKHQGGKRIPFMNQKRFKGKWEDYPWEQYIDANVIGYNDTPSFGLIRLYPLKTKTDSCSSGFYLK